MAFQETLVQIGRDELTFWTGGNHRECLKELPENDPRKHVGVAASATEIVTIGGNVSNRVRQTTFPAKDGILTPKKELICVLECRK